MFRHSDFQLQTKLLTSWFCAGHRSQRWSLGKFDSWAFVKVMECCCSSIWPIGLKVNIDLACQIVCHNLILLLTLIYTNWIGRMLRGLLPITWNRAQAVTCGRHVLRAIHISWKRKICKCIWCVHLCWSSATTTHVPTEIRGEVPGTIRFFQPCWPLLTYSAYFMLKIVHRVDFSLR